MFGIILIICLPVVWSLFKSGFYYSHDGAFHLVRLGHFFNELMAGQFPVRYSQDLLFRHGYPVFNYFYPLPYYFGSLIHFLGFDLGSSIKILMGISTIGSIWFFYLFLEKLFGRWPAVIASVLWAYLPYRLLAMYVTGSVGVIMALFWVVLALFAVSRHRITLLSFSVAGLILSHNVSALMFLPIILLISIILNFGDKRKIITESLAMFLGVALSSFFIVPALLEKYMVHLDPPVVNYLDHFPTFKQLLYSPWGYWYSEKGPKDGQSLQAGFAIWMALGLSILGLFKNKKSKLPLFLIIIFGVTIFLMLESSIFIWKLIPILPQIQFPWRLLAVTGLLGSILSAFATKSWRWLGPPLVALALFNSRNYLRPMESVRYPDKFYQDQTSLWFGTTDIASEGTPRWVTKSPNWFDDNLVATTSGDLRVLNATKNNTGWTFETNAKKGIIETNLIYYPMWNTKTKNVDLSKNSIGYTQLRVADGVDRADLNLSQTPIERTGNIVSMLALLAIILVWFLKL